MKTKKYYLAVAIVAVLVSSALISSSVFASGNETSEKLKFRVKDSENHEDIVKAMENSDFDTWKTLMEENGFEKKLENITEENFNLLVKSHNLMQEGNFEEAKAIREELGFQKRGNGKQFKHSAENKKAIMSAIENNDYQAWAELMAGKPVLDIINSDNFSKLVEAHNLFQAGDFEAAKVIKDELGFQGMNQGNEFKRGFDKGMNKNCPNHQLEAVAK